MRVREWGRGGGGGGGTRARESIRRRLSGGAQDLYCDRDHVSGHVVHHVSGTT